MEECFVALASTIHQMQCQTVNDIEIETKALRVKQSSEFQRNGVGLQHVFSMSSHGWLEGKVEDFVAVAMLTDRGLN